MLRAIRELLAHKRSWARPHGLRRLFFAYKVTLLRLITAQLGSHVLLRIPGVIGAKIASARGWRTHSPAPDRCRSPDC
jgi:hypothetical protein